MLNFCLVCFFLPYSEMNQRLKRTKMPGQILQSRLGGELPITLIYRITHLHYSKFIFLDSFHFFLLCQFFVVQLFHRYLSLSGTSEHFLIYLPKYLCFGLAHFWRTFCTWNIRKALTVMSKAPPRGVPILRVSVGSHLSHSGRVHQSSR